MSRDTVFAKYEQLFDSRKYSDLVLACQGEEFNVHKAIVCGQSPVLAAACDGSFKEAASNRIYVEAFDATTVKRMLLFMYTRTYHDSLPEESDGASNTEPDSHEQEILSWGEHQLKMHELRIDVQTTPEIAPECKENLDEMNTQATILESLSHVKMNAIAEYYGLPELRDCANARIKDTLSTSWSPQAFPVIVREAFSSTNDKELHKILSEAMTEHADEVIDLVEGVVSPDTMSDFAIRVVRKMATENKANKAHLEDLESRLHKMESTLTENEQKCENLGDRIEGFNKLLNTTERCRNTNCGAEFLCYMEGIDQCILRCAKCKCKHRLLR